MNNRYLNSFSGLDPTYRIPSVTDNLTIGGSFELIYNGNVMDLPENACDIAHFGVVHGPSLMFLTYFTGIWRSKFLNFFASHQEYTNKWNIENEYNLRIELTTSSVLFGCKWTTSVTKIRFFGPYAAIFTNDRGTIMVGNRTIGPRKLGVMKVFYHGGNVIGAILSRVTLIVALSQVSYHLICISGH